MGLAQKGDKAAFSSLVARHAPRIHHHLLRMLGGQREEAEDLTQETFLSAYRSIKKFRADSKFHTWLRKIATNVCLNHFRKKRPVVVSLDIGTDEDRALEIPDEEFSPELLYEGKAAQAIVNKALAKLSDNLRTVFILKEIEGYSHEETAIMLGVKPQAVRVRHHRAKQTLAKYLSESFEPALCGREDQTS